VSGSTQNVLLQDTKKLFSFLGLRPSNSSGAFTFSCQAFRAIAGGGSGCTARIGPSRCRRSCTVMLSGSPRVHWVCCHSPHPYPACLHQFRHFCRACHWIHHWGGVGSPQGAAGPSCSHSSEGLSGSEGEMGHWEGSEVGAVPRP
jgi:hypothetical protein